MLYLLDNLKLTSIVKPIKNNLYIPTAIEITVLQHVVTRGGKTVKGKLMLV